MLYRQLKRDHEIRDHQCHQHNI